MEKSPRARRGFFPPDTMKRLALVCVFLSAPVLAREGFFPVGAYHALAEADIPPKTLVAALPFVGSLGIEIEQNAGWKEMDALRTTTCGSDLARAWNRETCASMGAPCRPDGICRVPRYSGCAGVAVDGFFVTTSACARGLAQSPRAKFIGEDGLPREVALEATALTQDAGSSPLSLLRLPVERPSTPIRRQEPKDGEPVFAVGFPRFEDRARKRADYKAAWGEPRIVFGSVVGRSPETGAALKNFFLADTDSLPGMAGAPLFDRRGRLIGIGLEAAERRNAEEYDPAAPAPFAGVEEIRSLIASLADAERKAAAIARADEARSRYEEARSLEGAGRWPEAEAAYRELKNRFGNLPAGESDYAAAADKALRFVACETGRHRPRRTFPRLEYLESVAISAIADGSRERLLDLLPCRTRSGNGDVHAEDLSDALLAARVNGVPPLVRARVEVEGGLRASLEGMARPTTLLWRRDGDRGWAFAGAVFK